MTEPKEKFGIEIFKRNHKCDLIKAIEASKLCPDLKDELKNKLFGIEEEGTGVGIKTTIICLACEEEYDITNYEVW